MSSPTVEVGGSGLGVNDVEVVARGKGRAVLTRDARLRLDAAHAFVRKLANANVPVYGLTTGCGPLATYAISPEWRDQFQRNLVRSHATTLGPPHPTAFVRAAMLVRAQVFSLGCSGVHADTVDLLLGMLDAGIHPIVREVGSVGASGDLVELAEIALAMLGDGMVEFRGRITPAAIALQEARLAPLVPRYREGVALINGTSFHTGTAAVLAARAHRVARAGMIAAAMMLEALRGNAEPFDAGFYLARRHRGHRQVAVEVARMIRGSQLVRANGPSAAQQDPYTLRCIPQVLGVVVDELHSATQVIEAELASVTDNPLFLVEEQRVIHGGNFHGQPVAMALDHLKTALVELGVASERRVARVLDATLNAGLPPFLVTGTAGLRSGLMGLQYCASSMAADNAVLASPASVRSVPTNANNQDVVSMGMVAGKQAAHVLDNVQRMIAIELLCAAQALDLRAPERPGVGTHAALTAIRERALPLTEDRPLGPDVEAVCDLIDSRALEAAIGAAAE